MLFRHSVTDLGSRHTSLSFFWYTRLASMHNTYPLRSGLSNMPSDFPLALMLSSCSHSLHSASSSARFAGSILAFLSLDIVVFSRVTNLDRAAGLNLTAWINFGLLS